MNSLRYTVLAGKLGPLLLCARDGRLTGLFFADQPHAPAVDPQWVREDHANIFLRTIDEVNEFADGERQDFSISREASGTPFQLRVWREIAAIPYGTTTTYGAIAESIGAPASVRAVGTAAGRNPLCLIVPCHRVIGSSGALTGYAGGLERKRHLLDLESASAFASCASAGTLKCKRPPIGRSSARFKLLKDNG